MTLWEYIEDHLCFTLCAAIWLIVEGILLLCIGVTRSMVIILTSIWIMFYLIAVLFSWRRKAAYMLKIVHISQKLDQPYLLHEMLPKTPYHEDTFYQIILYTGYKSMLEEVSHVRRERNDYREYVEQWVHEVKTPISAMKLLCENQKLDKKQAMLRQVERIQHYIDQALFYARSDVLEKDFQIRETSAMHCVHQALLECKYSCMQANIHVDLPTTDMAIYTDEKWLVFILCQLLENAVTYRNPDDASINITFIQDHQKIICVNDHGRGIPSADLPRIFEKGFTGNNGRYVNTHATGIGLYLVKRLCDQMQITIHVDSVVQKGSTFYLSFHN